MYKLIFYEDKNGKSEVKQYIQELSKKKDKFNKTKYNKIVGYMDKLKEGGLSIGEPYIKYLNNDIWELRPLRDRILFAYFDNNEFILLNYFIKKTRKTPKMEIEKAKRLFSEFKRRRKENE